MIPEFKTMLQSQCNISALVYNLLGSNNPTAFVETNKYKNIKFKASYLDFWVLFLFFEVVQALTARATSEP